MTTPTIDYETWTSLGNSIPPQLEWLTDKVSGYITESTYISEMSKGNNIAYVIKASKGPDSIFDNTLLFDVRQVSPADHYVIYYIKQS